MEKNKIKQLIVLSLMCVLTSSCCQHKLMNPSSFQTISYGTDINLITEEYGPPYDAKELENGMKQYRYIQRNQVAKGVIEYTYFIIIVSESGQIIQTKTEAVSAGSGLNYR